ncbi:hypothetical protein CLV49_0722 [Labedella gwakjiensis]|uniref:Uncharacterized protein n=1 Tax=Labedella gwakjiensis TaxID=390269 RepID=A0A2P8GT12_9MICO|nr:hypothetical protein [Labedella gwakjiensis]PSL37116.1 hypothetical protein CLV49_0722 [Labedella gwakjiensis]RUQ81981.1 hypothetical protein ELQ93_16985 [Labedella gwakjiensis]
MSIDTRHHRGSTSQRNAAQHARTSSRPVGHAPSTGEARPLHEVTALPSAASVEMIRAGVVETDAGEELVLERVTPNVLRVAIDHRVLGFVEHVGRVQVALAGENYDRAVEVAQTLDVAEAARALA